MSQISDLNQRLSSHQPLTASDLGVEGESLFGSHAAGLPGTYVLARVSWDGSPEFPEIYGHFSASRSAGARLVINLHTTALRLLSRQLAARHLWGVGPNPPLKSARPGIT